MSNFNPNEYLIRIRNADYLEVKWRLVWMREEHPLWSIQTDVLDPGDPVIVRAVILTEDGHVVASGHGEYPRGRQFPAIMKAETSAIGRALAHAGFGTQFAGEDVAEPEVVDAPVERPQVERGRVAELHQLVRAAASLDDLRDVRERVLAVPAGTAEGEELRDAYKRAWERLEAAPAAEGPSAVTAAEPDSDGASEPTLLVRPPANGRPRRTRAA